MSRKTMYELGLCSLEDQQRIEQHWAEVRAGLKKPEPHEYSEDPKAQIELLRFKADEHIRCAANFARQADALAKAGCEA